MNDVRRLPLQRPADATELPPQVDLTAVPMLSPHGATAMDDAVPAARDGGDAPSTVADAANLGNFLPPILGDIYGAALGRSAWTAPLLRMQQSLSFKCGLLSVQSDDDPSRVDIHSIGVPPRFRDALPDLLDENDPFFAGRAVTTMLSRTDPEDARSAPAAESAFINEWVRPQGLEHGACARARLRVPAGETLQLVLMIWRPVHVRAFSRDQIELVKSLLPHFRAGIRIHEVMKLPTADWRTTARMLDRLPIGVVVVGRDGRPVKMNNWAAGLVSRCDGVFVTKDGLEAASGAEHRRLRDSIERAFGSNTQADGVEMMVVTRNDGEPLHIFVHVLKLPSDGDKGTLPLGFAFIVEKEMPTQEHGLLHDYGLTVAEARVALSIAAGHRLDTVAQQLGVSLSTARTHLQRVFGKTGTQRQVELVRLLLTSRRGWVE